MMRVFGTPFIDYVPALSLAAVTGFFLAAAYGYPDTARLMPAAVGWIMLALLLVDLASRTKTGLGRALTHVLNPAAEDESGERFPFARQASAIFWPCLFTALLMLAGVIAAVPLYVFASMRFHGRWSYRWSLATAVLTLAGTWLLFEVALQVWLYPGIFFSEF